MFTCIVCNKEFKDMYPHIDEAIKEQTHYLYGVQIRDSIYTKTCFCGGQIGAIRDKNKWEIFCLECLFCFNVVDDI